MKYLALIIFLGTYVGIGCQSNTNYTNVSSNVQTIHNIEFTIVDSLVFNQGEFFFSFPEYIVTDKNNNVYVVDPGLSQILFFDSNFQYQKKIGNRGRGPSEFIDIKGASLESDSLILIFDRSMQLFKFFNSDGKLVDTFNTPYIYSKIHSLYFKGNLLLIYLDQQGLLFHYLSDDYQDIISTGMSISNIELFENPDNNPGLYGRAGSSLALGDSVLFAPKSYDGRIYINEFSNGSFNLKNFINGYIFQNPIEHIPENKLEKVYIDAKITNPVTQKGYIYNNWSLGLFKLSDGKIVHFTYIEDEDESSRSFGVEVYDAELKFLGYEKFFTKQYTEDIKKSRLLNWDIPWKDSFDRFYLIDREGRVPKVKVFTLNIDNSYDLFK